MTIDAFSAIKVAFKELVARTPYSGITISEISNKANVSRKTFYRYFDNKGDIAIAIIQDDFVYPIKTVNEMLRLDEIKSANRLMMERLYRVFSNSMDYYGQLIAGIGREAFVDMFVKEVADLSKQMFVNNGASEIEAQYTSDILTGALALSLIWWLDHRDLDYRQMADMNIRWIHFRLAEYNSFNWPKNR